MTYGQWKTEVLTYLDVDARRRGIEPLRDAAIAAAARDLKFYVPRFRDNKQVYADGDLVLLDVESAEAGAEFVKSRLARNIRNDLALSNVHMTEYRSLRRRLFIGGTPSARKSYTFAQGEPLKILVPLLVSGVPTDITGWKIWFTVKKTALQSDAHALAQLDLDDGIAPYDLNNWLVTLVSDKTKEACPGEYIYEIEVENPIGEPSVIEEGDIILRPELNRAA